MSTKGKNAEQVPESLVKFLKFVAADIEQSEQDFEDEFVVQLQKSVHGVKISREMGERYMIFEEMMEEERNAGRKEGALKAKRDAIFELLEEVGVVSKSLTEQIGQLSDGKQLKELLKLAARSTSIDEFEREAQVILSSEE